MIKRSDIRVLLIADIEHEYVGWIIRRLEIQRYQGIVLRCGLKVIGLVEDLKPNLIIACMDSEGFKICERVKKKKSLAGIPFILIHDDDERFDSKADFEITMSYEQEELYELIDKLTSTTAT